MAGTVGSVNCTFLHGEITPLTERVVPFLRLGIDGFGAQLLGKGESEFRLTAVQYGSDATVRAWATSIRALKGATLPVTITVDQGTAVPFCLITAVSELRRTERFDDGAGDTRGELSIAGVVTN